MTERTDGFHLLIVTPDGKQYRISASDNSNEITINSIDGAMIIKASVSNQIRIGTNS